MTHAVVIMGVTACGKTTLGRALASALGWHFIEGDTLHPRANIEKMAAGIALDDEDRQPFLERVADVLTAPTGRGTVVSCSALKRRYRDLIRAKAGPVVFVLPRVAPDVLAARLAGRRDHFMPSALLESQLATLEPPSPDERAVLVDGTAPVETQVEQVIAALALDTEPR